MPYKRKATASYSGPRAPAKRVRRTYTGAAAGSAFRRDMSRRTSSGTGELKGVDTDISLAFDDVLATTNTNGSMFTLNLVPPGTASYNRIGRKIRLKSLRLQVPATYVYTLGDANTRETENRLRMVVVWDKQPSGAVPTWDTIFGSTNQVGTEASGIFSSLRFDNTDRFRVLLDKQVIGKVESQSYVWNGSAILEQTTWKKYYMDEYIKLGGRETVFGGQASPATIADISSGGLYVFFRADQNDTATSQWTIGTVGGESTPALARLRYSDN